MNPFDSKPGLFDVSVRMFGTSLRIKPSYWIFLALFGYMMGVRDLWTLVAWVIAGVVTTLVHELGQVIAGRIFGYPGAVILAGMGGGVVAEYERAHRWQRIVIAAAGLLASVLFLGLLHLLAPVLLARLAFLGQWEDFVLDLFKYLLFKVVFDIIVNMLPILPSAAGKVATELFGYVVRRRDFIYGTILSIVVTAGVIAYSLYKRSHPDAPYFNEIFRAVYPHGIARPFGGKDIDPVFIAVIYGIYGIIHIVKLYFALFGRKDAATRVDAAAPTSTH